MRRDVTGQHKTEPAGGRLSAASAGDPLGSTDEYRPHGPLWLGRCDWTGDWDPIWDHDVDTVIANIDNPKPAKTWSYWQPSLQLRLWFVACLDAIEAGVITADQIPPESGLNAEVVAALKAVEEWDLSDEWHWCNTPVGERGEYPILQAHLTVAAQCREIEADELKTER